MPLVVQKKSDSNELIVRDTDGSFKILRGGALEDWSSASKRSAQQILEDSPATPQVPPPSIVSKSGPKSSSSKSSPSFYFDVDDEEEIEHLRDKAKEERAADMSSLASRQAKEIINKSGIQIEDEVRSRLERAIISRLKDIRDLIETKDVLKKAKDLGGVSLNDEDVNKLLRLIEQQRSHFEEQSKDVTKQLTSIPETKIKEPKEIIDKEKVISKLDELADSEHKTEPKPKAPSFVSRPRPQSKLSDLPIDIPDTGTAKPYIHPSYATSGVRSTKYESEKEESKINMKERPQDMFTKKDVFMTKTRQSQSGIQDSRLGFSTQTRPQVTDIKPHPKP